MLTVSDDQLQAMVEGAARSDAEATADLYRLIRRKFACGTLQKLRHDDWEDVFHDGFLILMQAIRRGKITKETAILGYMKTVLERLEAKKIKRLIRDRMKLDSDLSDQAYQQRDSVLGLAMRSKESPYRDYAHAERVAILIEELARMQPKDREILQRFYLDGEKPAAIMAAMHLTANQMRLNKCRAKKKLEKAVALRLNPPPQAVLLQFPVIPSKEPKPIRKRKKSKNRKCRLLASALFAYSRTVQRIAA